MIKIVFFAFFTLLLVACEANSKKAKISFSKDTISFSVPKGKLFHATFDFKNEGNDSLLFRNVDTGCECAVTVFPKHLIAPNSSSKILVTFDSQFKDINSNTLQAIVVESNTEPMLNILYLKGYIQ